MTYGKHQILFNSSWFSISNTHQRRRAVAFGATVVAIAAIVADVVGKVVTNHCKNVQLDVVAKEDDCVRRDSPMAQSY